jgi:hypothetical protein
MVLKKRCKKIGAYMTIEASLIMPMVIGVYLFLIFSAFYLYSKCVLIQDTYLKCYRASLFTYWEEGYGEVGYGMLPRKSASEALAYISSRNNFKKYPFFDLTNEEVFFFQRGFLLPETYTQIRITGISPTFLRRDYSIDITATSSVANPVIHIRQVRRAEKGHAETTN